MQPIPKKVPISTPVEPVQPKPLTYPDDVVVKMKITGTDYLAAQKRLNALPRDEAENVWANVVDHYRLNTDMSSKVAGIKGPSPVYTQQRMRQPANEKWTIFDDMGSTFKNSIVDLSQGIADFIPSTTDLAMSAISNPSDTSWYRQWDDATDKYFEKAKYYVSPEAQSAVYDEKTGLNWRAVAGMTGSTMGFMATTMLPIVGQVGRAGKAIQGASLLTRMVTDPRLQSGAIGYLQALPGYKESAIKAGYTRNQAALIAPILSAAQAGLEFAGADALMKGAKLSAAEASTVVRQLGNEAATEAFTILSQSGKALTEDSFKEIINVTGKNFFKRLAQPEVRQAIFQNVKAGALSEGLEELTQTAAEKAIQKMADTYYDYDAQGGKGFDPTVKQFLIEGAIGTLMGGAVGGSVGGFMGTTPTQVGQQTIWGKLDADVRGLLNNNPDLSLENNKQGLATYRMAENLLAQGKLTEEAYGQTVANLDAMTRVSERLAKTGSADAPTRYAIFNLDSQQQAWSARSQQEVDAPMTRLAELADERAPGQWFPKEGLNTLDQAEAYDLISRDLPRKQGVASQIQQTISQSVAGLMNPQTRSQTLKSYAPALEALASQWDSSPTVENQPQPRPDQYAEGELPVSRTMDTPDGRFGLAETADGPQVVRVETATEGKNDSVSEDTDPIVGRFKGYKLPSKGQPVVTFKPIDDTTRHDELLAAFERNADVTEDYNEWRGRLSNSFSDSNLDGLQQAEAQYEKEAGSLPADAPDWQRQDIARKRDWLRAAMAGQAADSTEAGYNCANWAGKYMPDELADAKIDATELSKLPPAVQSAVIESLQAGNVQQAKATIKQATSNQTNLFDDSLPATPEPDTLPAQLAAETERSRQLALAEQVTDELSDGAAVLDQIEQLARSGPLTADAEQQLVDAVSGLAAKVDGASDAVAQSYPAEPGSTDGPQAGTIESETPGDRVAQESGGAGSEGQTGEPSVGDQDVATRPAPRRTEIKRPIIRTPVDLTEAILLFFARGGRIRSSDVARYGDKNWMKGPKNGNPLFNYVDSNARAQPIDEAGGPVSEILESMGRTTEDVDLMSVISQVMDALQSFTANPPTPQLVAYQQAQLEAEAGQADALVEESTAKTPLQWLEPIFEAMDQLGVPTDVQDAFTAIIADDYITADGLDWVGVVDLMQENELFTDYPPLRDLLLPMITQVAQQVPVTQEELQASYEAEINQRQPAVMSNDWWEQLADTYSLSDTDYNQLTTLFYGEPTQSRTEAFSDTAGELPVSAQISTGRASGENNGVPGPGVIASQANGQTPTDYSAEPSPAILTPDQQARLVTAGQILDADIASIQRENTRLIAQANKLRKEYQNRLGTGDVLAQPAAPFNPTGRPAVFARSVDVPGGFSDAGLAQNTSKSGVYEIVPISPNEAIYRISITANSQQLALSDPYAYLQDGADYKSLPDNDSQIVTTNAGRLVKSSEGWQISQKATIRFESGAGQLDLSVNQTTGLAAEAAVKEKIADLESQILANNERLTNLESSRSKLLDIARLAPEQATLFQNRAGRSAPIDAQIFDSLVSRLRETFSGVLDDVRLLSTDQLNEQLATETGQLFTSNDGVVYGVVARSTLYLNSDNLNANTPIHEFGHVWNLWARTFRPDLYQAGVKKARKSPYYDRIANAPFYQEQADRLRLEGEARETFFADEALTTAIGDKGEQFVQQAARSGFRSWLDKLWSAIKDKLGIESLSAAELEALSLDEFAAGVAARLLEGSPLETGLLAFDTNEPLFQYGPPPTTADSPARPVLNQTATQLSGLTDFFKKGSQARNTLLQQPASNLADYLRQTFEPMAQTILQRDPGSKLANQLLKVRANGMSLYNPVTGGLTDSVLNELAVELVRGRYKGSEATGRLRDLLWEGSESGSPDLLTAYQELLTEQALVNEDGGYEWPDADEESRDILASVEVYTDTASDPFYVRLQKKLMTSKWASNILLPETVGNVFSLGDSSTLQRITRTIRRQWAARAAEVRIRRDTQLEQLTGLLKGLSKFVAPGGTIGEVSDVKRYSISGWINGQAANVNIPIGDWIDLYLTARTQLATTGRQKTSKPTSSVLADVTPTGQLIASRMAADKTGRLVSGSYGYQYTAPGEERPQTILISPAAYRQLEQQLLAEHSDILQLVGEMMSDPVALAYVRGLYQVENGEDFPLEDMSTYFPTQQWSSPNDRDSILTVDKTLENARQLQERKTPPAKVVGRDVLARLSTYANVENRYIANSATRLNLSRWRKRNADAVDLAPKWLTKYLENLEEDLNDPYNRQADESPFEFEVAGVDVGLRAWMKRFSQSTFGFSLTTPAKQLTTALNLYGMGIIDNQYLTQALPVLARLGTDAYTIARQSAKTSVFGKTLAEVPYLEKLASNPYMSTILNRIAGSNESYLGQPTMDDLKAQPLNASVALARKLKQDVADPALRWVRAADRSVILFMAEAAELQITAQIAAGSLRDESGRAITDINSEAAMQAIARLTEAAVYTTNTMLGEGEASPLQRDRSITGAILSLYSGQQQRLLNSTIQSVDAYLKARALGDPSADALRGRAIWTATNLLFFNALAVGLINLLYRSLSGLLSGDDLPEDPLTELSLDTARGILGSAPSLPTSAIIAASTWVDQASWSNSLIDYPPAQAMEQTVKGLVAAKDYMLTDDPETADKRLNALTYNLVSGGANLAGLPAQFPRLLARMAQTKPEEKSE